MTNTTVQVMDYQEPLYNTLTRKCCSFSSAVLYVPRLQIANSKVHVCSSFFKLLQISCLRIGHKTKKTGDTSTRWQPVRHHFTRAVNN